MFILVGGNLIRFSEAVEICDVYWRMNLTLTGRDWIKSIWDLEWVHEETHRNWKKLKSRQDG